MNLVKILAISTGLAFMTPGFMQEAQAVQPMSYDLPGEAVFPEGIAIDEEAQTFYVTSTSDGTIFRGDIASGEVDTFIEGSEGQMFATIGLAVDNEGRLWVAGGGSGTVSIYDLNSGELVNTLETPAAEATFLNDVVVSDTGEAYITDSNRPILFKATTEAIEPWLDFTGTAFEYVEGFNANGIVLSDDGQYLLIVQINTGQLYRVDTATQDVTEVDLEGETLENGDGLVLDGQTLYVVRNANNEVAVVELADDFASGTLAEPISDDSFAFPTTAALLGDSLFVVNSQFDKLQAEGGAVLPFTVSRVTLP